MMQSLSLDLADLAQTQALAKALGPHLQAGDCVLLEGELGAGKSTFARALIQSLAGAEIEVPSPTYTLVQSYLLPQLAVHHFDLYRLSEPDEVYELGWEDILTSGACLIEWPSRLGLLTPPGAWQLTLEHDPANLERRKASLRLPKSVAQSLILDPSTV